MWRNQMKIAEIDKLLKFGKDTQQHFLQFDS